MYGVMIPEVSAGSNQVGASEICAPQVSCPCGAANAHRGTPAAMPNAPSASNSRRLMPDERRAGAVRAAEREGEFIGASGRRPVFVAGLFERLKQSPADVSVSDAVSR